MNGDVRVINEMVRSESAFVDEVLHEVDKVIVGQRQMVERVLLGMLTGGHVLLEGVPGLAKTLTVNTLAATMKAQFQRIQFTPDLLPADLIGTMIYNPRSGEFSPKKGPIFSNIILADEINRTPPKTQAAMLQTMQEREVSVGRETYALPSPFFVFATRNPIEQEGTYQLPEAATDRFMLSIQVNYPTVDEEIGVVSETTGVDSPELSPVLSGAEVLQFQRLVRAMPVSQDVIRYAVLLANASRPESGQATDTIREYVRFGAGPRASQYLILGAKGRAAIAGDPCVSFDHVRAVARQVLEHRVLCNFKARSNGVDEGRIVEEILSAVSETD